MTTYDLEDDYGRHTKFEGELLLQESTDTEDRRKPQWTVTVIYRTAGGRYVVWSEVNYRVRHTSQSCHKAAGHELIAAEPTDTWGCPACGTPNGPFTYGYAQANRVSVDVCETPNELVARMSSINQNTGLRTFSQYSQALLAELSDLDPAIREVWMERVVV